jgi:DNA-binding transcriptional ArsR family regulator
MTQFDQDRSGVLIGRAEGDRARHSIEAAVAKHCDDGQAVALDFAGIRALTVSFADACVGQLLSGRMHGYYETHPFLVLNGNEEVRDTLAVALERRRLVVLSLSDAGAELLGAQPEMNATIQAAQRLGRFRVGQLAAKLGVSPQAANNRLKALVRSGALERERVVPAGGGKEFEYFLPSAGPSRLELADGGSQADGRHSPAAAR